MEKQKKLSPAVITVIVIALIGIATAATIALSNNSEESTNQTNSTPAPSESSEAEATEPQSTSNEYKDGQYEAVGNYTNPGGSESVEVKLTLSGGKVTQVETTGSATSGNSKQYQEEFLSGYKSEVVGKDIDTISLSRVAGSSLTSTGFNAAIEAIKAHARV